MYQNVHKNHFYKHNYMHYLVLKVNEPELFYYFQYMKEKKIQKEISNDFIYLKSKVGQTNTTYYLEQR